MLKTNLTIYLKEKASKFEEFASKSLSNLSKGLGNCFPVSRVLTERLAKAIGVETRILQMSIDTYKGVQYHNLFGEDERINYEC